MSATSRDARSSAARSARRATAEDLGAAARGLVQAVVDTTVDDETLARAAALAREAAGLLERAVRAPHRLAEGSGTGPDGSLYSPVTGLGNPVSPPIRIVSAEAAGVVAECILHRVHEGPPTYGHGGMSAMIMDQVLGVAVAVGGSTGLTRSLETVYHRPVPLGQPLRLTARVTERSGTPETGMRVQAAGEIAASARPGVLLVTATASFAVPRPDQLARLFGHVETGGAPVRPGD